MSGRSYLSIGDVLTLLRQEFPDVTISKIRFLESQGLVNPERTPSGYRKFYEQDVERLRWVLRQQREHFLPLKVIKDRLGDEANGSESSTPAETGSAAPAGGERGPAEPPRSVDPVLVGQGARAIAPSRSATPSRPAATDPVSTGGGQPTRKAVDTPAPGPPVRLPGSGGTSSLYDQEASEGPTLLPVPTDDRGAAARRADHDPAPSPGRADPRSQATSVTPTEIVTSPPADPPAAKLANAPRPARPPKPASEP
ncbi:MAG: MerR family transcriptional regulator, partial [Acidimicrobiales bacterium]